MLLAAVPGAAAAQAAPARLPEGAISGTVLDAATSEPLAGATVVVEPAAQGVLPGTGAGRGALLEATRGVLSDSLGNYRFVGLAPGRYRLRISRAGYRPSSLGVELQGSADTRVSVGLTVEPVVLEAIEVTAEQPQPFGRDAAPAREQAEGRVEAARARQRRHLAADARELTHADVVEAVTLGETDLFRALQRLPGVATRDDFTAELWTRGASWDQTRVLFDGLPLFHPLHGMGVFSGVSPDAIGAGVLHPGVRPSSLGEGAAAVLDLTSRRGAGDGELRGSADLSLASARLSLDQRVLDGRGAWMIAARRTYLDWLSAGVGRLLDQEDAGVPYAFSDLAARVDLQLDGGRALEASAIAERDRIDGDVPDVLHGNTARWGNTAGRVTYASPLGSARARHTLGLSRYAARVREREPELDDLYSAPSAPRSDSHLTHARAGGEIAGAPTGAGIAPWRVGYEVVGQSASYDGPPPRPYGAEPPPGAAPLSRESTLGYGALWGERRWEVRERLSLEGGLRLEGGPSVANGGPLRLAPRLSARYQLLPELSLSAGAGRSYQYAQAVAPAGPSFHRNFSASQFWVLADGETPALRSDIATLGVEGWLGGGWLAAASAYLRRSSGLALPDPTPGPVDGRPLWVEGDNDARGVELSARRLAGRWTASLGYSYALSELQAGGLRFAAPADRRHALDATAMARVTRSLRLGAAYTAASGAPYTRLHSPDWSCPDGAGCDPRPRLGEPGAHRTPAYASLDLLADWTGSLRGWEVGAYLQLRNALGRDNASTYDYTSEVCPGRGFVAPCPTGYQLVDHFQYGVPMLPVLGLRLRF